MPTSAPFVRAACLNDAHDVARRLRFYDAVEIMLGGKEPREGVVGAYEASMESFVLCDDFGLAVAIGGVTSPQGLAEDFDYVPASPWLMACQGLSMKHINFLVKHCRDVMLPEWYAKHGLLYNHVWAGNSLHMSWCRLVGFKIEPEFAMNSAIYHPITYSNV